MLEKGVNPKKTQTFDHRKKTVHNPTGDKCQLPKGYTFKKIPWQHCLIVPFLFDGQIIESLQQTSGRNFWK